MNRDLTDTEIDDLLHRLLYGHLGCITPDGQPYVVPVTFAYRDGAVYSFSFPGQKLDAMRNHPSVCFQTEEFLHEGVWQSAILWGTYEELSDKSELEAARLLFRTLELETGTATSPLYTPPPHALLPAAVRAADEKEAIFYRIRINRKTGRYIRND